MPKKDIFEMPYIKAAEKRETGAKKVIESSVGVDAEKRKKELREEREKEFEDILEERVAEAQEQEKGSRRAERSPRAKTKRAEKIMEQETAQGEKLKRLRQERGITKMTEQEKETEKSRKTKEEPAKKEEKAEQDLAELRADMKREEPEEDMENINKGRDGEIYRHLRANLSDYPQFLTPEIKINLKTVQKQKSAVLKYQNVIEKNTGNAKKKAQDKIKEARQNIKDAKDAQKRAQDVIDGHLRDIVKQYNSSDALLSKLLGEKKELADKVNEVYKKKMGKDASYEIEKRGLGSGIKKFFKDNKLKKKLGKDEWEKFEELKFNYLVKVDACKTRLSVHTKKYEELDKIFQTQEK